LDLLEERLGKEMSRWQWQRLHTLEHSHRPFSDVAALKRLFHRSIPNGGNRYTVNVGPASWSRPFEQRDVPSYRQIIDLADLNNSRFSQTTGQSGNVLSRHYDDFVEMHRDVQYLRPSFGRDQAQGATLRLEKP
jgi:penicillin amidase